MRKLLLSLLAVTISWIWKLFSTSNS